MFMPIASPVVKRKRRKIEVPKCTAHLGQREERLVPRDRRGSRPRARRPRTGTRVVSRWLPARKTGARVMPTSSTWTAAPPASRIAAQPRLMLARSAPSVVAMRDPDVAVDVLAAHASAGRRSPSGSARRRSCSRSCAARPASVSNEWCADGVEADARRCAPAPRAGSRRLRRPVVAGELVEAAMRRRRGRGSSPRAIEAASGARPSACSSLGLHAGSGPTSSRRRSRDERQNIAIFKLVHDRGRCVAPTRSADSIAASRKGWARPARSAPSAIAFATSTPLRRPPLPMIVTPSMRRSCRIDSGVGMPQPANSSPISRSPAR